MSKAQKSSPDFATAEDFLSAVLSAEANLAVFDCDGTLWSPDSGEGFMRWEMERGLLSPETERWILDAYAEYRAGNRGEEQTCGEMVAVNKGLNQDMLEREAAAFWEQRVRPFIFPEMIRLLQELRQRGCEIWAVSSTADWVVSAGVSRYGIPAERVLAACVHIENGLATDRLLRVPSGPAKATAVREQIGRTPDIAFGNSIHDLELLECARRPFVVNPNPNLEKVARERGWPIYYPRLNEAVQSNP